MKATEMIIQLQELINEYGDLNISQKEFDEYDQNYKYKHISKIIADYNNNLIPEFYTVSESKQQTYIPKCCNNPNWKRKEYDYISIIKQAIIDKGYVVSKYVPENRTLRVVYKDIYLSVYVGFEYHECYNCFANHLQEHIQKIIKSLEAKYEDELQRNRHAIRSNLEMREFNAYIISNNNKYEITAYNGYFYIYKKLSNYNLEKLAEFDSQFLTNDEIINKIKEIVYITHEDIQEIEDYLLTINQYDLY